MSKLIISRRKNIQDAFEQYELFSNYIIEVDEYYKTHLFANEDDGEISSQLKKYLYMVFNVSNQDNLLNNINDGDWTLYIKSGYGEPTINTKNKEASIYYDSFEIFYDSKKQITNAVSSVRKLYEEKNPSSNQLTKVIAKISEKSGELVFSQSDKNLLANSIPNILVSNNIKLKQDDIIDINKLEIMDIINLGRKIIHKDRIICKEFDVKDPGAESVWQKYFERYGTYLLFGSIRLDPQKCLDKEITKEYNNKYPDLLTCNRFGFLDIIELKRSDRFLFQFDDSHKKFVPTPYLSSALSQLNGYLQIIPYAYTPTESKTKGLECASGMLIAGSKEYLYNKNQTKFKKWQLETNQTDEDIYFEVQKELRRLNYSYSHMQVVLYDELINTLELFVNNISNKQI